MNQITKENILSAIAEIDKEGIRSGRHSRIFDEIPQGWNFNEKGFA